MSDRERRVESLVAALKSMVAGDTAVVEAIYAAEQAELARAAAQMTGCLELTRRAVRQILRDVRDKTIDRESARLWSEFMSFGTVDHLGRDPIEIGAADDEVIDEALFRLREIDDPDVGRLADEDIEALLEALK